MTFINGQWKHEKIKSKLPNKIVNRPNETPVKFCTNASRRGPRLRRRKWKFVPRVNIPLCGPTTAVGEGHGEVEFVSEPKESCRPQQLQNKKIHTSGPNVVRKARSTQTALKHATRCLSSMSLWRWNVVFLRVLFRV